MLEELPLVLDRDADQPLSVQVAEGLRAAASNGLLRAADRLPSSRALAQHLGVSRTVVAAAYDQLHAEGWIAGRRGSGTFLTTAPAEPPARPSPQSTAEHAPDLLDLGPGAPCIEALTASSTARSPARSRASGPVHQSDRAIFVPHRTSRS